MEIVRLQVPGTTRLDSVRRPSYPRHGRSRVAIGTFDGVHLGHRQVLAGCDTVLTFDPHPMRVLAPQRAPKLLSDRRLKMQRLDAMGVRRVAIVPFDSTWSEVSAHDFVSEVLLASLGAEAVSVGRGFRFGAGGAGTISTFAEFPALRARVVPLVGHGGTGLPISSTRIRELVTSGQVELAAEMLGAPFTVPAVVRGSGRLSIPADFARPSSGSYLGYLDTDPCSIHVDGDLVIAVTEDEHAGSHVQVAFTKRIA